MVQSAQITKLATRVAEEDDSMAVEEDDAVAVGEDKADEVPDAAVLDTTTCAGSLSPRGYNGRCSGENGGHGVAETLHLDQVAILEQGDRRVRRRGVRAPVPSDRELRRLKKLVYMHKLAVVGICEPKFPVTEVESIRIRLKLDSVVCNSSRELAERERLWEGLLQDKPRQGPWYVVGDFNLTLSADEKRGGRRFQPTKGLELSRFMYDGEVFDAGFTGPTFTWCNNRLERARIWKRLDRVLVNMACLEFSLSVSVSHLVRAPSDHAPLLISFTPRANIRCRSFRFLNIWPARRDFLDVIRLAWQVEAITSPLYVVWTKLKSVSQDLHLWNKETFGNVFENVKKWEAAVTTADLRVQSDLSVEAFTELQRAQSHLNKQLAIEDLFWRQKARIKWLQHGDLNSKYFHSVVKQRRIQSFIHRIRDSRGKWVTNDAEIGKEAVRYFGDLFTAGPIVDYHLLHVIPNLSSEIDNTILEEVPSFEEVRKVIFEMDGDSAAGPDGFTGKFFVTAWEVVGQGDPLSPALFIISLEVLSRDLNSLVNQSSFTAFKVPKHCFPITHLAFVDDVIIFANGGATSLKRVMQILEWYQHDSGQLVNVHKSGYLVHPHLSPARQGVIARITRFQKKVFPIRYLGAPLFIGRAKVSYFSDLRQKVLDKVLS
nr:uncharacterized protein LOC113711541 [Coffea arabica]